MPPLTVVSNTSPIFYLHRLGQLELLPQLYGAVQIPTEVFRELERGRTEGHGAPDISALAWVTLCEATVSEELQQTELDPGELEAIALALAIPDSLILLDDREARRVAAARGLTVSGTLGVLIQSKQCGLLPALKPLLERLPQLGFRMGAALQAAVLQRVGEH